jgi:hypothetical protein
MFGWIIITATSSYQSAVIVHHYGRFAPSTSGDEVLLTTAASPYEPPLKMFFTPAALVLV